MMKIIFHNLAKPAKSLLLACTICASVLSASYVTAAVVSIQPIQIRDDDGMNAANVNRELYATYVTKIYAQVPDLQIQFLSWRTHDATASLDMEAQAETTAFFAAAPQENAAATVNIWFASVSSYDGAFGEVNAVGGNRVMIFDNTFATNRHDTISHELGHTFGLGHADAGMDATFLMRSGGSRTIPTVLTDVTPDGQKLSKLTAAQIGLIPEPASVALLCTILLPFLSQRRRQ